MSAVEFILSLKDRMSGSLDRVTDKSENARRSLDNLRKTSTDMFDGATRGANDLRTATERQIEAQAKMRAQAQAYWKRENAARRERTRAERTSLNSIGKIQERITALNQQRKLVDPSDVATLGRYNRELWHLNSRLKQINQTGLAPTAPATRGRRLGIMNTRTARGGFLGGLLGRSNLYMAGGLAVAGGVSKAVQSGAEQQHSRLQMQNEFGSERGNKLFNSLRRQSTAGAFEGGLALARSGVADKDVIPMLRRIGDVANGSEAKMTSLVDTFVQMNKDGKLTAETLRELERNGLNPLNIMNQKTGESFKSMFDRLEAGEISVHEVTKALRQATEQGGKFFGNLDRLDDSALSRWSRFKDTLSTISANFGEGLLATFNIGGKPSAGQKDGPSLADRLAYENEQRIGDNSFSGIMSQLWNTPGALVGMFGDATKAAPLKETRSFSSRGRPMMGGDDIMSNKEREAEEKRRAALEAAKKNQDSINRVNGGGQRVYNITVGKLIETMNNTFQGGVKENANQINQIISQELIKLLASSTGK